MSVRWGKVSFFRKSEFDYPDQMGEEIVFLVDELRRRLGIRLKITSDFRTDDEMEAIYGIDRDRWINSPHQRGTALDIQPMPNTPMNRFEIQGIVWEMHEEGAWPRMGFEMADKHCHVDCDTVLKRPHFWIGKSR